MAWSSCNNLPHYNWRYLVTLQSLFSTERERESNKVQDIGIKNRTYYLFDDCINTKNFDPNNIKIDTKSHTKIFLFAILDM